MYYITMDMGTSNTRLQLWEGKMPLLYREDSFGAGDGKRNGRSWLLGRLRGLFSDLLSASELSEDKIESVVVSGMAGSEFGLREIPHVSLPADVSFLTSHVTETRFPEICNAPFVFVPGLKKERGSILSDIMRGEETESVGLMALANLGGDFLLVLPGTHNKIVDVDSDGRITDFCTTLSGELLHGIVTSSILCGDVSHQFTVSEGDVVRGAAYSAEKGLNAALFHVRVMAKNGIGTDALSSFLYGAVLGQDTALIRSMARGRTVFVSGRETLRSIYGILLGNDCVLLEDDVCRGAVMAGLRTVYELYRNCKRRPEILQAIEREKLISIVRNPDPDTFLSAAKALYDGGIRLIEVTFDRGGSVPKEESARLIRELNGRFDGMLVGAGTVTSVSDVLTAYSAGASFIISPNCDPDVILMTRKLGLVSIPAAYTPTEIVRAIECGADFVKLFPADGIPAGYVKAVRAPVSDAKLLAVGGVDESNAATFLQSGFVGVGVGSNLYDKNLIRKGDFVSLSALARKYVTAVRGNFS